MNPTTAMEISAEVSSIHAAAYERQREHVSTLLDEDLAMCVLRIALSPAERLLLSGEHGEAVSDQRQAFEQILSPTLRAAVERATGRAVAAFHSSTHLEHELTVLLFMFTPVAQSRSAGSHARRR
jgi:uncharacterized protein YbcI